MTKNWEKEKDTMHELYMVRGMKLSDMQKIMEEKYNFKASERAYKQKFKEWKWFKKTRREDTGVGTEHDGSSIDTDSPTRSSTPQYNPHSSHPHLRPVVRGSPYETSYQNYGHHDLGADPRGPTADPPGGWLQQPAATPHAPNMTLAPIQGGPRGPLPPMSYLQQQAFRDSLKEAELRAELGQYDLAQRALEGAMRTLQSLAQRQRVDCVGV